MDIITYGLIILGGLIFYKCVLKPLFGKDEKKSSDTDSYILMMARINVDKEIKPEVKAKVNEILIKKIAEEVEQ